MGSKNSPLNEAIGKLISRLRKNHDVELSTLAHEFNLTQAYVKQIEYGLHTLPPYAVVGLTKFLGMNWATATGLVTLASYLDTRKDGIYNYQAMLGRIAKFREICPREEFKDVLNSLEVIAKKKLTNQSQLTSVEVVNLRYSMESFIIKEGLPHKEDAKTIVPPGIDTRAIASYGMSPFFEDIVDNLAEKLSGLPTLLPHSAITKWEHRNKERIGAVFGFMSCPNDLESLLNEADWPFLWNSQQPKIQIILGQAGDSEAARLESIFKDKILSSTESSSRRQLNAANEVCERIKIIPAGTHTDLISNLLYLDFVTQSLPSTAEEAHSQGVSKNIHSFQNVWIYRLRSSTSVNIGEYSSLFGYLGNFDSVMRTGYALELKHEDIQTIMQVLNAVSHQYHLSTLNQKHGVGV